MIVDLVQVQTRDGVRLDGSLQSPVAGATRELPIDVAIFVHGAGGSFYSSALFDGFGERLLALGVAVLRINTRGHDLISTAATTQGGRRQGAAYEIIDDCRHDLAAWIDWLARRGFARIALIGHSTGAVKSIYVAAYEPNPAVAALVAISPPRLSHSHFAASSDAGDFLDTFARAELLVNAGHETTLLDVRVPLPFVITAGGYVEKYGPDERYNFLKFIDRVRCPTLVTFGSIELESNMAFAGLPQELAPLAADGRSLRVETIANGDHFYVHVRDELIARVESWLQTVGK